MLEREHIIAMLYFAEEAFGYRQSLHWFRRYLETNSQDELRRLAKEICRENFIHDDQWQQVDTASIEKIQSWINQPTLLDVLNDYSCFVEVVGQYFEGQQRALSKLYRSVLQSTNANWKDALSRNQVRSKVWLLNKLEMLGWLDANEVVLVGGWLGILPFLSSVRGQALNNVVNIDIDQECHHAALTLNQRLHKSFCNFGDDIRTVDFSTKSDVLVVDTIVEHFQDHGAWVKTLPKDTKVALQGNDMFGSPDHVNCHSNLEEFVDSCGLSKIIWKGQLEQMGCTRYMILGQV